MASKEPAGMDQTANGIAAGTRLGPYEIEAPLGAGGMGQVFRARDTRLGRAVAIKIVHERFSERFQREARAISSLNHPNICTLFDVGPNYLVMELIEGDTLAVRLKRGSLSMRQTIQYGGQIADALAAAHAKGIIHRDLKPGNIMLTKSGVKVLDFGLAKAPEDESLTATSAVMGTPAYMAPEQREGRETDVRTDIYAFGLVLYEMVGGKGTPSRPNADLRQLPPQLARVVERCLSEDPENRWHSAADVRIALGWAVEEQISPSHPKTLWRVVFAGAAVLIAAIVMSLWQFPRAATPWENPLANAQFTRLTNFEGDELGAAISRDGKFVAFRSDRDGPVDVFVTQVGSGSFTNLTHGKEAVLTIPVRQLGFSPDGSEIWLGGAKDVARLRLMPLMGGTPRAFLNDHIVNINWSSDGNRLAYHTFDAGDPMFVADRSGLNSKQLFINPNPGGHTHFPTFSPDGRWIYFIAGIPSTNEMDLYRIRASGGQPEQLTHHNNMVGYPTPINDQTLLYVSPAEDGSGPWLWALDVNRKITRRISFGLEKYTSVEGSADGRRLVASVANPSAGLWMLPILNRVAGERDVQPYSLPTVRALAPRFGGGSLFYLSSRDTGDGLWRYRDGQTLEIWKGSEGALLEPAAVSPDGKRAAILLRRNGKRRLNVISADGAEIQPLSDTVDVEGAASWSPDVKWIVTGGSDKNGPGLFRISADGATVERITSEPALNPVWSPDGSMIIYVGRQVALWTPLRAVRPNGERVELPPIQLRGENGERFRFMPDGKALVYMQGAFSFQDFWLLDLTTMKTRQLARLDNPATMLTFDITPDGAHIVFDRLRQNSDVVLIDLPPHKQ